METRGTRERSRLADVGAVAAIWAFVSFGSTAQRWTGLDTPDSEFYATLGLFGHEVTDRAVYPVYYWTRFGTILPVRGLTEWLGSWPGYHVFWLLLVGVVVAASFLLVRRFTSRLFASLLTLFISLNTVTLSMLGNPYVSGTVIAATFVMLAALAFTLPSPDEIVDEEPASHVIAPLVSGLALGWMAMTNPYGAMLATAVWLAATLVITLQWRAGRIAYIVRSAGLGALGAAASFGSLLLLGEQVFPGMDWFETNRYWSQILNSADYVTDIWSFHRDILLIVPVIAMISVLLLLALRPLNHVLRLAAVLSPAAAAFAFAFLYLSPSNTLEVPHYQALQWPPALAGVALAVAAIVGRRPSPWWVVVVGAVGVVSTIVVGHWTGTLQLEVGWIIAAVVTAVFAGTLAVASARLDRPKVPSGVALVSIVVATSVLFATFQLLQNAHRPLTNLAESPFSNAFNENDVFTKLDSAEKAQSWLIDQTTSADSVMVWVDADWGVDETLLPLAAFQIWGANQITPLPTLYGPELERAEGIRPSVVAMYGRSMRAVTRFWASVPGDVRRTDPQCTQYPWPNPDVPTAYVCLARLDWS